MMDEANNHQTYCEMEWLANLLGGPPEQAIV